MSHSTSAYDLTVRYPATLDYEAQSNGYEWDSDAEDVWKLSRFRFSMRDDFAVEFGACQVVFGCHGTNVLWAVLLPDEPAYITKASDGAGEQITSAWLRFHPGLVGELFPADSVLAQGENDRLELAMAIAGHKLRSSWHVGNRATVPPRSSMVFDIETKEDVRRFFDIDNDRQTVRLIDEARTNTLPVLTPLNQGGAVKIFDKVWKAFDREYAMFAVKPHVDWNRLREEFRPQASKATTAEELARVISQMVSHLEDLHVFVRLNGDYLDGYTRERPLNANVNALEPIIGPLVRAGTDLEWGRTSDDVGYISVDGLRDPDTAKHFEYVLQALDDAKGLVVDLRFNGGGGEPIAQQIAAVFLDRRRVYAMSQYRSGQSHSDLGPQHQRSFTPHATWHYTGPVIVLQGQRTMSSAEAFVLMLQQCPNVTTMGDRTAGSSGNPRVIDAGAGIMVNLPRWIPLDASGKSFDTIGIEPDVELDVAPSHFVDHHDPVLTAALERLRAATKSNRGGLLLRDGATRPRRLDIRLEPEPADPARWIVHVRRSEDSSAGGDDSKESRRAMRTSRGWSVFDLAAGHYVVQCYPPETGSTEFYARQVIEVNAADESRTVTLRQGSVEVSGRVTGLQIPAETCLVHFLRLDDAPQPVALLTQVNERGEFAMLGIPPGRYLLSVEQARGTMMLNDFEVEIQPSKNHFDLTLSQSTITGRVIGKTVHVNEDLPTAPNLLITRVDDNSRSSSLGAAVFRTDADGSFVIHHVPPGKYFVSFRGPPDDDDRLGALVTVPDIDAHVRVDLQAPADPGAIAGRINDWESSTADSAAVRVFAYRKSENEYAFYNYLHEATIDPTTGTFHISGLEPGTWALMVCPWLRRENNPANATLAWVPDIEVSSSVTTDVELVLDSGQVVEIQIAIDRVLPDRFRWSLVIPDGTRLPDLVFPQPVGILSAVKFQTPIRLRLPSGQYTYEADFGGLGATTLSFTVNQNKQPLRLEVFPEQLANKQ